MLISHYCNNRFRKLNLLFFITFGFYSLANALPEKNFELKITKVNLYDTAPVKPALLPLTTIPSEGETDGIFSDKKWAPQGGLNLPVPADCQPLYLEDSLINATAPQLLQKLKDYFDRCDKPLSRYSKEGLFAFLKLQDLKYNFFESPYIKKLSIEFNDGHSIAGFMAIKPDTKKRPFIVIKCGIFCNGGISPSTQILVSQLFDESPFNILLLASHSGISTIKKNHRVAIGGWLEGQEMIAAARWLSSHPQFKSRISSLHGVGMSLGGAAALYASVYNDHSTRSRNDDPSDRANLLFKSVTAACPVVNLQPTLVYLFEKSNRNLRSIFVGKVWDLIVDAYSSVPDLHSVVDPNDRPHASKLAGIIGQTGTNYFVRQIVQPQLPPMKGLPRIESLSSYWDANNFLRFANGAQTPTLVWGSKDDMMVNNAINTGSLTKLSNEDIPGLQILNTRTGNHCMMPISYGWSTSTAILRGFILSKSPAMLARRKINHLPFAPKIDLDSRAEHVGQKWQARKGKNYMDVTFITYRKRSFCRKGAFRSKASCYKKITSRFPLSQFPTYLNIKSPMNETASEVLTRWANSNLKIVSHDGPLIGTKNHPTHVEFVNYL